MMKMRSSLVRSYSLFGISKALMVVLLVGIAFAPVVSQAKAGDDQTQIILLNDSAAALEDTNPGLSKNLAQLADEKEKEWEDKNAHKDVLPTSSTVKNKMQIQDRIKLLKSAALAIQPSYPLIAKSLDKMAKDMNETIKLEN